MEQTVKNILITGSNGFIGTNLITMLPSHIDYQGLDIATDKDQDLVNPSAFAHLQYPLSTFDAIVHLAARPGVLDLDSQAIFNNNVVSTFNVLEYAKAANIPHVIFASSGAVMSEAMSPYGVSKMCGEHYCRLYSRMYGITCSILRFGNVYGPYSIHKSSAVHKFIRQILDEEPVTIRGDGSQSRAFIYVEDIINNIVELLQHPKDGTFAVSAPRATSIAYLVHMLCSIAKVHYNISPEILHVDSEDEETTTNNISNSASVDLMTGLTKTFKWYYENYGINDGYIERDLKAS